MKLIVLCLVVAPCWAIKESLDSNSIDVDTADKKTPTKKATLIGKKPSGEKIAKLAKNPALEKKSTNDEEKAKVLVENNFKGVKGIVH